MLIYSNDGKLHSVSKKALQLAGYHDIAQFLKDHNDYSELFVKKPGYIYNFENFSWLSFLRNANPEQKRVLISTNDKATYECELGLEILFPVERNEFTPEFYFQIEFHNMRLLTGKGDTGAIEIPAFSTGQTEESRESQEPEYAPVIEETVAEESTTPKKTESTPDILLFGEPEETETEPKEEAPLTTMESPSHEPIRREEEPLELMDFTFGENEKPEEVLFSAETEKREIEISTPEKESVAETENVSLPSADLTPDIPLKEDIFPGTGKTEKSPLATEQELAKPETPNLSIEMPDIRKVSGTLGLPETMVKAFVKEFVDTYVADTDDVKKALESNRLDVVKNEAMKLKGIASNLMMEHLTETLETLLATEEEETIKSLWKEVDQYMRSLSSLLTPEAAIKSLTEPPEPSPAEAVEKIETEEAVSAEATETEGPAATLKFEEKSEEESIAFDPAEASNALGLPESLIIEFVNDFIEQAEEEKANFEKAFEAGDIKTINEIAHKLKGVAANLRIEDMRSLMESAQHATTPESVEKSLNAFYSKLAALTKSMAKEYA